MKDALLLLKVCQIRMQKERLKIWLFLVNLARYAWAISLCHSKSRNEHWNKQESIKWISGNAVFLHEKALVNTRMLEIKHYFLRKEIMKVKKIRGKK